MFYTVFISASLKHLKWIRKKLYKILTIKGHLTHDAHKVTYHLKYAKRESLRVLRRMYYSRSVPCLSRKRLKIERALGIIKVKL